MPIIVTQEPEPLPRSWQEKCCFCGCRTTTWYTPKDVAVCQPCAKTHEPEEVPTKTEWCEAVREPRTVGRVYAEPSR